jgi:ribosomal protein S27E
MSDEGGPAFPTLRCPDCGHADLLFGPSGSVRCGHCMRSWTRDQLVRTRGRAGSSYDRDVKEDEEG